MPAPKAKGSVISRKASLNAAAARRAQPMGNNPTLPKGTVTRSLKAPNKGQSTRADLIQRRLKKKSPWFISITDPLHGSDCKIPDETGVETGTFQIVERHNVFSNSSGFCGFRVMTPYINSIPIAWASPPGTTTIGANLQWLDPTATNTTFPWGAYGLTGVWEADKAKAFNGTDEFGQFLDVARVVSAGLYVQPEPSLSNNQGEYTLFCTPFALAENEDGAVARLSYDEYANHYKSISIPLNKNQPGVIRWFPFARSEQDFKAFYPCDAINLRSYDGNITSVDCPAWELGMVTSGIDPDKPVSFRVTVVVNLEFTPKFNSMNFIDTAPSPADATETDLVENWVQDLSVATVIPSKQLESSPSAVELNHGENDDDTGLGMWFNVLKEAIPIATGLATMLL